MAVVIDSTMRCVLPAGAAEAAAEDLRDATSPAERPADDPTDVPDVEPDVEPDVDPVSDPLARERLRDVADDEGVDGMCKLGQETVEEVSRGCRGPGIG